MSILSHYRLENSKKIYFFFFLFSFILSSNAQNSSYEDFKKNSNQKQSEFKEKSDTNYCSFRDKVNKEYAEFMRQSWERYSSSPAIAMPKLPDFVTPPVAPKGYTPTNNLLTPDSIIGVRKPYIHPEPIEPVIHVDSHTPSPYIFKFYNTECTVNWHNSRQFALKNLTEEEIAKTWVKLSDSSLDNTIADCLVLREQLDLCDWAYIQLIKDMSESFYNSAASNEATLLQMYILTQSGYKVRIARSNNRLLLLLPSEHTLYGYSYISIDNEKYFVLDKSFRGNLEICTVTYPNEKRMSLQMDKLPKLDAIPTKERYFASKHYPEIKTNICTNQNLIDFYNDYPISHWSFYAKASLSETIKNELYPVLRNAIKGKSKKDAANMLINFVQTAFEYQTDEEQFGYERPLFPDETFFYPYSDCEDRAILYAVLVKDLLGLEVVLLHYPAHLATAVCFNDNTAGDYLIIDDERFLVCDPTYIGASVGQAMPKYKNVKMNIIKI
ncbi:hypothetical protein [Paludibacter sp. 221]|uniref:hypothetical protein n=1 Tax=Paludibacter sp. 221 TaxID=2302939 RepID=UPI0013CFD998|nr:hypothetical protein [Paludibacter sp. 221]